jgi:hypothetical protein
VRHAVERAQLVQDVAEQFVEGHVQGPAAETGEVAVAHVRADSYIELVRGTAAVQHGDGVAGVEPAGNVSAGDQLEHRGVVPHGPGAE